MIILRKKKNEGQLVLSDVKTGHVAIAIEMVLKAMTGEEIDNCNRH